MAATTPPAWAQAIRARRESLGRLEGDRVTQEAIAARTGDVVSQRTVSHLEKGTIELTSLAYGRVIALAKALNWTLPELQLATGLSSENTELTEVNKNSQVKIIELPEGLKKAIYQFGDHHKDLHDIRWQQYLARIKWSHGQPREPGRWLDVYRDLVRNGIEPECL